MRKAIFALLLVGCAPPFRPGDTGAQISNASSEVHHSQSGPCELVEAMLLIDNPHYQEFFHGGCSSSGVKNPLVVDVQALGLVPADARCPGRGFRIYRGEPIDELIVRLTLRPKGNQWHFIATMFQPTARRMPDGTLEAIDSYCVVQGGFVELRDGAWRTFYDFDRVTQGR